MAHEKPEEAWKLPKQDDKEALQSDGAIQPEQEQALRAGPRSIEAMYYYHYYYADNRKQFAAGTSGGVEGDLQNLSEEFAERVSLKTGWLVQELQDIGGWPELQEEAKQDYFLKLQEKVEKAYAEEAGVNPERHLIFYPLRVTPLQMVRVVLLGQDPTPVPGQAAGIAFSGPAHNCYMPGSLKTMLCKLKDIGVQQPHHGFLGKWCAQGVLCINTVWTVKQFSANSHEDFGWQTFTEEVLKIVSGKRDFVVFVLFGNQAKDMRQCIDGKKHKIIEAQHPSPKNKNDQDEQRFLADETNVFEEVNKSLEEHNRAPIDWQI